MPENRTHEDNYVGTTAMEAENQDMTFVNDTVEQADSVTSLNNVPENDHPEQFQEE